MPSHGTKLLRRRRKYRGHTACDACYSRKIKCDVAKPQCNWCFHHDIHCTFSRSKHSGPAGLAYTSMFPVRPPVKSSQAAVYDSSDHRITQSGTSESSAINGLRHAPPGTRYRINHISLFNGLPFFSRSGQDWIEQQTGEKMDLDKYFTLGPPWQVLPPSTSSDCKLYVADHQHLELPDKALVYDLLQWYKSVYALVFPFVVHPTLLETTIATAYDKGLPYLSPSQATAKACIFAFCALAKEIDQGSNQRGYISNTTEYANQAVGFLPRIFSAPATVDGLQVLLMLAAYYQLSSGDTHIMETLLSAATRFLFQLEANLDPFSRAQTPSPVDIHIRNLFWICYLMDKELCLRTGSPPLLAYTHCDLTTPDSLYTSQSTRFGYSNICFSAMVRLSVIQGRIYDQLYSPSALQKTETDVLRNIRALDEQLEEWRLSLPAMMRPTTATIPTANDHILNEHLMLFQIQWHYWMIMIHQASSRCLSWRGDQTANGLNSSLIISVQFTRSLLQKFSDAQLHVRAGNFRFAIFYVTSAVVTLFCYIVLCPLGSESVADIKLIQRIVGCIAGHTEWRESRHNAASIDMITPFIHKLAQLAISAVARASPEKRHLFHPVA